jgi:hypothetical protein
MKDKKLSCGHGNEDSYVYVHTYTSLPNTFFGIDRNANIASLVALKDRCLFELCLGRDTLEQFQKCAGDSESSKVIYALYFSVVFVRCPVRISPGIPTVLVEVIVASLCPSRHMPG